MRQLVIETATAACSVALFEDGELVAETHEEVGRGHAERLIPMIGALPDKGRADAILVDCGPGSFTGVRVGLAAARGLGLGWKVPVFGFSSLALIAAGADWGDEATLAVAINGGHGQLFVQRFERAPMRQASDLASLVPAEAAVQIRDPLVIGNGAALLVAARGSGEARDAAARAHVALTIPTTLRELPPTPIYGRAPDAKPMP
ncbi:tRNA (adenosine(37)-N6)-threonylcarbamoyltransferase complex dimerization subunit type 1 TsaB [Sphingomonas sp. LaA6.9]|uniref:tRNA (adenosine(37)-N6)-threonylcarbamoyltransferase complex dimerization subunit type 1 TsaB n=1 Tax=Sphingomonas sp. LaA6.9 TaxID=2919914 RepID=UPI001F4FCA4D|nr:tRNA (adenosine(37)-N6)-threonylcarbamoyltransferase complex dimerization subunit type 1 TsaB [Sphingomonas sp. LaA6.9]MCJ8159473.1 tRNA (adenosine(37)-N6)-threonylcarbamoyltransferase complex dimerization subunit type 1 TsaB [Sphingomonas sp. LaA6.9]